MNTSQSQEVGSASPKAAQAGHDKAPIAPPRAITLSIESKRMFPNRGGFAISPDGANVGVISDTAEDHLSLRRVLVFNPRDEQSMVQDQEISTSSSFDPVLAFAPDGNTLYFSDSAALNALDIRTGARSEVSMGLQPQLCALQFSSDGKTLACAHKRFLTVWSADFTSERLLERKDSDDIQSIALSPDGRLIAATDGKPSTGKLRIWDVEAGNEVKAIPLGERESSLAFSPEGSLLASTTGGSILLRSVGGKWGVVREWESRQGDGNSTMGVAFSPDGSLLASFGSSGVHVWDPQSGALLAYQPIEKVYDFGWLDGGRRIVASAYQEGVVLLAVTPLAN